MSIFRRGKKADESLIVDSVTGAFNRRQLDRDIANGIIADQTTSTLMIDVDHFADYTGKKGSPDPDQVLERVAWVIMATVRTTDVVYRHAQSSFCVLLPSTSDTDAVTVADRIRSNVEKMPLLSSLDVSISIGVASGPADDVAGAVDRAVTALGRAMRGSSPRRGVEREQQERLDQLAPADRPLTVPDASASTHGTVTPLAPPVVSSGTPLPPPPAA